MLGKAFVTFCGAAIPAAYLMGSFGSGGIDRVVGASPAQVRLALQDLDIRDAPGEPATDPTRSGNVEPTFKLTEDGDDMIWTVMSGEDVAVRMIAHLEPVEDGTKTRVTASVERGNAPDDFVAPAFRSKGLTLGLFSVVLEDELDDLVRPAGATAESCQRIVDEFTAAQQQFGDTTGFAGVSKTVLRLNALESRLKAAGCKTGFSKFGEIPERVPLDQSTIPSVQKEDRDTVSFEPGKPMTDLSKHR